MFGLNHTGQQEFNAGIACAVLSGVAVAIRIFCKIHHKQGVRSDDFWILGALGWYYASVAISIWGRITGGGGAEMKEMLVMVYLDPTKLKLIENYLESLFLGFTFITCAVYALKMSILFFYRRIFFITKEYQRASLAVMIIATAWFIATQIGNLLICQPIDSFWHRNKPGKCLNFNAMFLGTTIVETFIDFAILLLPVRFVLTIQLPLRTRVAVASIFALGGFVVITNSIRVYYIYQPHAKFVNFTNAIRWTNIHMVTAFVCACLPIYKPLWSSISTAAGNLISMYASSIRSLLRSDNGNSKNTSYLRMERSGNSTDPSLKSTERNSETDLESGFEHIHVVAK